MLHQSEARSQEPPSGLPRGCRVPRLWAVFDFGLWAFPGHKQGAGWEVELLGLELVPICDPGVFKARTLADRPCRLALKINKSLKIFILFYFY